MNKITIAIDGHSSCGKSTLAKALAAKLGYAYLDTGAMYRAVTLFCLSNNIIADDKVDNEKIITMLDKIDISFIFNGETNSTETYLNGDNVEKAIRKMHVSEYVSIVSEIKEVRKKMVSIQQVIGKDKGVVVDGRDIGTVVFPDAELKFFMTADVDVRAERRYKELIEKGISVQLNEVKKNLQSRDKKDSQRDESPLMQAADAIVLDSTFMDQQEQLAYALHVAEERIRSVTEGLG